MRSVVFALSCCLLLSACSKEEETVTASSSPGTPSSSSAGAVETYIPEDTTGSQISLIPESNAKNVAMRRANVSESDIQGYRCTVNNATGVTLYDITFWVGTIQHFYTISATDGSVVSFSTQFHATGYDPSKDVVVEEGGTEEFVTSQGNLTIGEVQSIIASHANISTSQMTNLLVTEGLNGSIPQYQITFSTSEYSYLYYVASSSGTIFSSHKEPVVVFDDFFFQDPTPDIPDPVIPDIPDIVVPDVVVPDSPQVDSDVPIPDTTTSSPAPPPVYGENEGLAG